MVEELFLKMYYIARSKYQIESKEISKSILFSL